MTRTLVGTPDPEPQPVPGYGTFSTSNVTWSSGSSSTTIVWSLPANR